MIQSLKAHVMLLIMSLSPGRDQSDDPRQYWHDWHNDSLKWSGK